ncbi:fibronectin type III domain-containing protein [Paenibacillus sp. IITD108]|uniref:fibronectin type III domain-containing protein n=1 Tax=Paenibacillus sp. IITD108 TaxID=3116649 RepID=UPI002F3F4BD2
MFIYLAAEMKDYQGLFDPNAKYSKGNVVSDEQNSAYLCLVDNVGIPLSDPKYWALLPSVDNNDMKFSISQSTDVDFTTKPPQNKNVLAYQDGKWVPFEMKNLENAIMFEEWAGALEEEPVELLDDAIPAEVENVHVTDLEQTSFILNWEESVSPNVKEYAIYRNELFVDTVPATLSKLQPISYQIKRAAPSTEYRYTIKVRSSSGYESNGVNIIVRTNGIYALQMNGVTDYIKLPSLPFDKIELTCQAFQSPKNIWYYYLDARPGLSAAYLAINGNGNVQYSNVWETILVNGKSSFKFSEVMYQKITISLSLGLKSNAADDINIFSDYKNNPAMKGKVYRIQIFLQGHLVAAYNLTEPTLNGGNDSANALFSILKDQSGNGKDAALFGGTWVIESN